MYKVILSCSLTPAYTAPPSDVCRDPGVFSFFLDVLSPRSVFSLPFPSLFLSFFLSSSDKSTIVILALPQPERLDRFQGCWSASGGMIVAKGGAVYRRFEVLTLEDTISGCLRFGLYITSIRMRYASTSNYNHVGPGGTPKLHV